MISLKVGILMDEVSLNVRGAPRLSRGSSLNNDCIKANCPDFEVESL